MTPLTSDRPLIVYVDFKSPYAYLAIEPTRELAQRLGIAVDWRPFVLDIPSFLGSAKLGRGGRVVEQNRTQEQWSGVKYAYFDCRRYANLRGVTVRGTVKIWNTELAAIGMLWAKAQGDAVLDRYLDAVFEPFWKRALDVEDVAVIRQVLAAAGADLAGFDDYVNGDGRTENAALQEAAFAAGIFGVPTFVVAGQIYFGREHLPRVAWHLSGEIGPAPDTAYWVPDDALALPSERTSSTIGVCVDFGSPQSYLCLGPLLQLADRTGARLDWHAAILSPLKPPRPGEDGDRGARHRLLRAEALARDIERYAPHPLGDLYADFDRRLAVMGLLWLKRTAPELVGAYVVDTFARYWRQKKSISDLEDVVAILAELGVDAGEFSTFVEGRGSAELEASQQTLKDRGVTGTPTFFLDDEPFLGRQHLPLIERRLAVVSRT